MRKVFKLLFILALLSGCSSDEGILCEAGPVGFTFEIMDEATGENLFENGSYTQNQLKIEDNEGEAVEFGFETERNVVSVLLGWETKSDTYTVTIDDDIIFNIVFSLERSSSGGCTSTKLTELEIVGATYEPNETGGITTIFVNSEEK